MGVFSMSTLWRLRALLRAWCHGIPEPCAAQAAGGPPLLAEVPERAQLPAGLFVEIQGLHRHAEAEERGELRVCLEGFAG